MGSVWGLGASGLGFGVQGFFVGGGFRFRRFGFRVGALGFVRIWSLGVQSRETLTPKG